MKYSRYKYLVLSDLYRITGNFAWRSFLRQMLIGDTYKYIFWMRTTLYLRQNGLFRFTLYPLSLLILRHMTFKFGIYIPFDTEIAGGFYIGHPGCIVVNGRSVIGRNCNISQGVTLGAANRGNHKGCPIIGDNVYIGPGAKIVGRIKIGNNVAIGANCVVTKDIEDNSVVVGIPGEVISNEGSMGYINRTDYDDVLLKTA